MNDITSNNNKLNLDHYMQNKPIDNEKLKQLQRNQVIYFSISHFN